MFNKKIKNLKIGQKILISIIVVSLIAQISAAVPTIINIFNICSFWYDSTVYYKKKLINRRRKEADRFWGTIMKRINRSIECRLQPTMPIVIAGGSWGERTVTSPH